MSAPTSTPPSSVQRPGGPRPRRWWVIALGGVLALAIVAGLTWQFVVVPQVSCSVESDLTREGAVAEYCLPGRFQPPNYGAMTVGSDGNLWFVDYINNKITRVTPHGALTEFTPPVAPSAAPAPGIVSGPDGNLWYITNDSNGKLGRVSVTGQGRVFALPQGSGVPSALIVGLDGKLWASVSASGTSAIVKMDMTGATSELPLPATMSVFDMVTGPDGNVWLVTGGNTVWRLTPAGALTQFATNAGQPINELTAGPDGNVWFITQTAQIGRITPAGTVTLYQAAHQATVGGPAIGRGPDGNLWFAAEQGKIGRITPGGAVTEFGLLHQGDVTAITAGPDGGVWFLLQSTDIPASFLQPDRIVRVTA